MDPEVDQNEKLCRCGLPTKKLTVKKEGKNQGRQFYQCSKPPGAGNCGNNGWVPENNVVKQDSPKATKRKCESDSSEDETEKEDKKKKKSLSPEKDSEDENEKLCRCGLPTKILTVKKEGKNQGRQFYQCSKPPGPGNCGNNGWVENEKSSEKDPEVDKKEKLCRCGLPAKILTVKKEGKNQGRQFYMCSKFGKGSCGNNGFVD